MAKKIIFTVLLIGILSMGCNIVPKSVQYQKEEQDLIGSTDIMNPVVEEIQVVLRDMGYDIASADGRMGQDTREAIKEFQESIGANATGYINKATLKQIDDIRRVADEREGVVEPVRARPHDRHLRRHGVQ